MSKMRETLNNYFPDLGAVIRSEWADSPFTNTNHIIQMMSVSCKGSAFSHVSDNLILKHDTIGHHSNLLKVILMKECGITLTITLTNTHLKLHIDNDVNTMSFYFDFLSKRTDILYQLDDPRGRGNWHSVTDSEIAHGGSGESLLSYFSEDANFIQHYLSLRGEQ